VTTAPDLWLDTLDSPLGALVLGVRPSDAHVCLLEFADAEARVQRALQARFPGGSFARRENPAGHADRVRAYFAGELDALAELPVDAGGTPFQQCVWRALREIPPGATRSYAALARAIGRPRAVRAVGAANGRNPIALAVPCHRVIGASGALTGYGGGLERKRWLLHHERAALSV